MTEHRPRNRVGRASRFGHRPKSRVGRASWFGHRPSNRVGRASCFWRRPEPGQGRAPGSRPALSVVLTTKEAAAGGCDEPVPKQASVEAGLHGAEGGAVIAVATTNEAANGACDGPVPKQAAADAGALAETSTRTTEDKWRPTEGENAAFNTNIKRLTGGPWEGNTQALSRTT